VSGGKSTPVAGKLTGDQIHFTAGEAAYSGQVNGASISGTVKSGSSSTPWQATRQN
jgi:hypothetical protein